MDAKLSKYVDDQPSSSRNTKGGFTYRKKSKQNKEHNNDKASPRRNQDLKLDLGGKQQMLGDDLSPGTKSKKTKRGQKQQVDMSML